MIGVLAAIAIPAYQDYTIRAQVTEGLNAAGSYKSAVAQAYADGAEWQSISTQSLKLSAPANLQYVQSIEVISGAIQIKYGNRAHRLIANQSLVLIPAATGDRAVGWICGRAAPPSGMVPAIENGAQYTSLANKYLPSACRGT
jgi:type IV pilus assembly protein PilA